MSRLTLRSQLSKLCFRMNPSWTRTSSDKELEQYLVDGIKETERELHETKAMLLLANAEIAALKSAQVVTPEQEQDMKRQTIWVVCCAVVTVTLLLKDSSVPAAALIGFYIVIGVPMFAHWLFEPAQPQSDDELSCDYCGALTDDPWHGSGEMHGKENRHIHACDNCRDLLPKYAATAQPQEVVLATDYAALEAECKRLLDLLADWSSHFTGPKVIGGPLSSLRERTDAALLNGGRDPATQEGVKQ